jgi:hypothetical protein
MRGAARAIRANEQSRIHGELFVCWLSSMISTVGRKGIWLVHAAVQALTPKRAAPAVPGATDAVPQDLIHSLESCSRREAEVLLLAANNRPALKWQDAIAMYYALFHRGWPSLAFRAKELGARLAVAQVRPLDGSDWRKAFVLAKALSFQKRYAEALATASMINGKHLTPYGRTALASLKDYLGIYLNRAPEKLPLSESYQQIIAGKSVAVVGPSASQGRSGPEIDSFDVIVRTNVFDHTIFDPMVSGSRTDVSYYNVFSQRAKRSEILTLLSSGALKHVVHTMQLKRPVAKLYEMGGTFHYVRKTPMLFGATWRLTGVQRIVADLLPYGPARIKLFNCDFYSGRIPYLDGYQFQKTPILKDLAQHDLLESFRFTECLFKRQRIEADALAAGLLSGGEDRYISMLDEALAAQPT